ncbi:hypothetical protein RHSIM_Rhsim13G0216800 [Rhododendron simsii]|uniref:Uncharacterized protein n=1 Tax=Rhododendron simsii TaxID=118357 RepID=A0A834G2B6_RHOSS|nr:hypothetical protein RHSIM_Rhsim13G0216800 [Rhododendron simsii]
MDRKQIALILFSVLMVVSLAEKLQPSESQDTPVAENALKQEHLTYKLKCLCSKGTTKCMELPKAASDLKSAEGSARVGAQRRRTRSHACSSARSVVLNACVCLREPMETSRFALATITGRPREEDPNALESGNTTTPGYLP